MRSSLPGNLSNRSNRSNDPTATLDAQIISLTYSNKLEKVVDFLDNNPDFDILTIRDARLNSLLHIASLHNQINICRAFLNHIKTKRIPADEVRRWINAKTDEGFTALHFASFKGNIELVKLLEQYGADIYAKNHQGLSVIHIAAQGDQPVSIAYFSNKGLSIDEVDHKGSTPLHWACFLGMENAAVYLTTWGSSPNEQDNESGLTPLHLAVISGNPRVVRRLLLRKADKNIRNNEGKLPIDLAIENEYDNIVQILQNKNKLLTCLNIKPGLERKRNRLSLYLLFAIFIMMIGSNLLFIGPYVEKLSWMIAFAFITLSTLLFLLLSWLVNPGFIHNPNKEGILNLLLNNDPHLVCPECVIVKPPRSKHCDFCNTCISVYDHHCPWINNCVGARNHAYFIAFTLFNLFAVIFFCALAIFHFNWKMEWKYTHEEPVYKYSPQIFQDNLTIYILKQIACLGDMAMCLIFIVPLAALNFIQIGNLSIAKTTNERFGFNVSRDLNQTALNNSLSSQMEGYQSKLKESAQKERKGCFRNWYTMCCENKDDIRYNYKRLESPQKVEKHDISRDSPDYAAI